MKVLIVKSSDSKTKWELSETVPKELLELKKGYYRECYRSSIDGDWRRVIVYHNDWKQFIIKLEYSKGAFFSYLNSYEQAESITNIFERVSDDSTQLEIIEYKPYTVLFTVGQLSHHGILAKNEEEAKQKCISFFKETLRKKGFTIDAIGQPVFVSDVLPTFDPEDVA